VARWSTYGARCSSGRPCRRCSPVAWTLHASVGLPGRIVGPARNQNASDSAIEQRLRLEPRCDFPGTARQYAAPRAPFFALEPETVRARVGQAEPAVVDWAGGLKSQAGSFHGVLKRSVDLDLITGHMRLVSLAHSYHGHQFLEHRVGHPLFLARRCERRCSSRTDCSH